MYGTMIIRRMADRGPKVRVLDNPWLDLDKPMGNGRFAFLSTLTGDERERIPWFANEGGKAAQLRSVNPALTLT